MIHNSNHTTSKKELFKIYLWTLSYFKPFILQTFIYTLSGGAMIYGELMIPRRMGFLIDHVLPLKNMDLLIRQVFLLGVVALVILISKSIYNYMEIIISNNIIRNQQRDLMKKLQDLGFSYYEKNPTGKILSLFENSVREVQKTYNFLFPNFIYCLAQFVVPSIILIYNQPKFFIAAMIGNIIYVFINQYANKKIHYYLGVETSAAHISQQSLYDAISSVTELKAMGSEKWFIDKVTQDFNDYRKPRMGSIFWRHFRFTTVGLTLTISIILFYLFGLELLMSGELMLGEFIGYSFLMGLVSRGFSVFFYIIPAQYHALSYGKDLYEFMSLEPEVLEAQNALDVELKNFDIDLNNVSFEYCKGHKVIDDISFTIPAGKKTAIVGESGSGKSTVLKLIGRFYDINKGSITIDGHDIKDIKLQQLRKNLGYVFQDTYLFNTSIMENIRFSRTYASDEDIRKAAKLACAHDFIEGAENGYETLVGERGINLSGGQRQRISIARTMLKEPNIILLDEATSALDKTTEKEVKNALDKLSEGKTLVAVAHRLSTIIDYDLIIVMENGKVVEKGNYNELMENKSSFYNLVMRGAENEN